MKKTIKAWLNELPEPYKSQALKNCRNPKAETESLNRALLGAFNWENTKQGNDYWFELWDKLTDL